MDQILERVCGLDVHKKTVVGCVITPGDKEIRTFGTMTVHLLGLLEWLEQKQVTHVVMESTGVYWKPVYNILEERPLELLLVNARHVKAVPGRKTDVKDAEWLADLLLHGLLKGSFVPGRPLRELRELTRHRKVVIQERARAAQRLQKVLEGANIKLSDVASDILGVSGRAMLSQMVEGNLDPKSLAEHAKTHLRGKREELALALEGSVNDHQRFMIGRILKEVEFLDEEIRVLSKEVEQRTAGSPFEAAIGLVSQIPGLGQRSSEQILAEIGWDMTRFPSAAHLASWAKICPGNNESAGKRRYGSTGHGNPWLRTALVEAARSAALRKGSYYQSLYRRIKARRGSQRAAVAVAHSLLVAIYSMLTNGTGYQDLGSEHLERIDRERVIQSSVKRLQKFGLKVTVEEASTTAA